MNENVLDLGIDPPSELPPRKIINVNGRAEHEELIKNPQKCAELGLDGAFETIVYLTMGWLA